MNEIVLLKKIFVFRDMSEDTSGDIYYDYALNILIWILIVGLTICVISFIKYRMDILNHHPLAMVGLLFTCIGALGLNWVYMLEMPSGGGSDGPWGPPGTHM